MKNEIITKDSEKRKLNVTIKRNASSKTAHIAELNRNDALSIFLNLSGGKEEPSPLLEIVNTIAKENLAYTKRYKVKIVSGYKITLSREAVYMIFISEDGKSFQVNLMDELVKGMAYYRQSEAFTRTHMERLQRYAHAVKQNIQTFHNFYGPLTDEQKKWMNENTISFEQEMENLKNAAAVKAASLDSQEPETEIKK